MPPKPPVFVSRRVPEPVRAELERLFELAIHDSERPPARAELLAACAGAHGLVTMLTDCVDEELLGAAGPELAVVANYAVGYDNVDLPAATRRGIVVSNTPDVLTAATAEFTVALILDLARRVGEGDRLLRRRAEWVWAPTFMLGETLRGRTVGIVGLGRIGAEVARLCTALGMEVVYTSRRRRQASGLEWLPLDELLGGADVVTLHCPLTPETHHLIDRTALRRMRSDAVLVNTARGPIVDEEALVAALAAGELAGAALDVFEREPQVSERLLDFENVVLAPHLASATRQTREAMGMLCVQALTAVLLEHRSPPNAVNPEALRREG